MSISYYCADYLFFLFFFFNDTATTEIYTLSLHDALPIWVGDPRQVPGVLHDRDLRDRRPLQPLSIERSEEHTSELQSRLHLVCRLLLEKKKKKNQIYIYSKKLYIYILSYRINY